MANYYLSDDEWIEKWLNCGSAVKMSKETGISQRSIYNRRRSIEARKGIELPAFDDQRINPIKKLSKH